MNNLNSEMMEKINNLELDYDEILTFRHKFLKAAVLECDSPNDLVVDNLEMPERKIKIDGYFQNVDEKEFHILGVIYDDSEDPNFDFNRELAVLKSKLDGFIFYALDKRAKNMVSTTQIFEAAMDLKDSVDKKYDVFVDIYTNCHKLDYIDLSDAYIYGDKEVKFKIMFIEDIMEALNCNQIAELSVLFDKDFNDPIEAIKISSSKNYDVYSSSINGQTLAKIYNKHKLRLLEGNVRSYLKKTQRTNAGILNTLRNLPLEFCAYNNGLSIVASADGSNIKNIKGNYFKINSLNNMQIVNGGQTTVTIYTCFQDAVDLKDVIVPAKITVLKKRENEAELVANISKYANTQTAIAKSDLSSNEPFYIKIQQLSRSIPSYKNNIENEMNKYFWFFERTSGQYNTEKRIIYNYGKKFDRQNPTNKKYSKKILAKAIMAFEQRPDSVCMGNEANFKTFNNYVIDNFVAPDEKYYKNFIGSLILWKTADSIIKKEKLSIKAAVLPYTIAKLSYETGRRVDLERIFNEQSVPKYLQQIIHDIACMIDKYFKSVINIYPNTLMYGRKAECWTKIKSLNYNYPDLDLNVEKVNFLPKNPANEFIEQERNFKNHLMWDALYAWNKENRVLSEAQANKIKNTSCEIRLTNLNISDYVKKELKESFIKAVRNGFSYKEFDDGSRN